MNEAFLPFERHLLVCAAAAGCSIALALAPPIPEVRRMTSAQLRAVYLECDRLAAQAILAPDESALCAAVADVLLQRDFGGVLELQLRWRHEARAGFTSPVSLPDTAVNGAGAGQASGRLEP